MKIRQDHFVQTENALLDEVRDARGQLAIRMGKEKHQAWQETFR